MNNFEELKRSMMSKILNREEMPEDVIKAVRGAFDNISEIYAEYGCNNSTIAEYMDGELKEVEKYLDSNVGEGRRDDQLDQLRTVLHRMERRLEETVDGEEKQKDEEKDRDELSQIGNNNVRLTQRVLDVVSEALMNVRSRQNKILDARGYSGDRIMQIQEEVTAFIKSFENRNGESICEMFKQDEQGLRKELLSEYEEYLTQNKSDASKKFRDSMNAGISLEDQHKAATDFLHDSEEKRK